MVRPRSCRSCVVRRSTAFGYPPLPCKPTGNVLKFWLVYVPVWIAVTCWFIGTTVLITRQNQTAPKFSTAGKRAGKIWMVGNASMVLHIIASYGVWHGWSHQAALRFTGDQSESVIGIRAESGLYANFAFVLVWIWLAFRLVANRPVSKVFAQAAYGFLAAMVFFATIVFEDGVVRVVAALGFTMHVVFAQRSSSRIGLVS